jgi:hypothetical protein
MRLLLNRTGATSMGKENPNTKAFARPQRRDELRWPTNPGRPGSTYPGGVPRTRGAREADLLASPSADSGTIPVLLTEGYLDAQRQQPCVNWKQGAWV